ncbi:hypothetical protein NL676_024497 [Syzygium grande]|nr:hypothetical protein NL676_024497 [Syzygium grande]
MKRSRPLGVSVLDTGNNNNLITLVKSNFPPYGRDFSSEENRTGGSPTASLSQISLELHGKGARRIGVFVCLPSGAYPRRELWPVKLREDVRRITIKWLNWKLSSELRHLNGAFPHARMALADTYGCVLNILKNLRGYGYVFWDSYRPTENVHKIVVQKLLAKLLVDLCL